MDRRRYLSLLGAALVTSGCLGTDVDGTGPTEGSGTNSDPAAGTDLANTDEVDTSDGGYGYTADDGYGTGDEPRTDSRSDYRHYIEEWFLLKGRDVRMIVRDTDRMAPEEFGTTGRDVYVLDMRAENTRAGTVTLDHDLFWLEKVGRDHPPDTGLSEQLDDGVTGENTELGPEETRDLRLAFRAPDDVEPAYLWIESVRDEAMDYYICIDPSAE